MKRRLEEFLQMYTLEVEDIGLEHHDLKESLPRDSLSGSMPVLLGCIPQRLGACICFSLFRCTTSLPKPTKDVRAMTSFPSLSVAWERLNLP